MVMDIDLNRRYMYMQDSFIEEIKNKIFSAFSSVITSQAFRFRNDIFMLTRTQTFPSVCLLAIE